MVITMRRVRSASRRLMRSTSSSVKRPVPMLAAPARARAVVASFRRWWLLLQGVAVVHGDSFP